MVKMLLLSPLSTSLFFFLRSFVDFQSLYPKMAMTTMERSKMIKIGTIIPRPAILVVFVTEVAEMHLKHKILLSSYHINGAHSNDSFKFLNQNEFKMKFSTWEFVNFLPQCTFSNKGRRSGTNNTSTLHNIVHCKTIQNTLKLHE